MKRAALYIRVSSDQQAKFGDSLREQQDTLTEYANSQKDMIIQGTYIDDGISGQKLDRDEFTRLMTAIKNDQVDIILFTKLDRWFRSLKHYLNVQDILDKHNVHWLAVSQPYYDTSTAYGRTFINQVMSFAELEAQMTSERMISVFKNKVKMGEAISGNTPFGYKIIDKHLVPDDHAPIAKSLFEYYDLHSNLLATSKYLLETYGISRTATALRRMFKNSKYMGEFRGNSTYCTPIVSKELYESVNRQLGMNIKSNTKREYLFSGLLVCTDCGRKMNSIMLHRKGGKSKDGTRKTLPSKEGYNCRYAYQVPKCINAKKIYETSIETWLLDNVRDYLTTYLMDAQRIKVQNNDDKIDKITKKLDRLKAAYLNEIISLEEFKVDREILLNEMNALQVTNEAPVNLEKFENILKTNFEETYETLDKAHKRAFWRSFIRRIEFDHTRKINVFF